MTYKHKYVTQQAKHQPLPKANLQHNQITTQNNQLPNHKRNHQTTQINQSKR